ncbi:transporter substrate-binding domain-containing protein [Microbacterium sp.]|uniref:transporter substrate-binding domain-containing protein n=1 Tax=Microbacterium sp. TaxID=51671 RepID=UPI0039E31AA0
MKIIRGIVPLLAAATLLVGVTACSSETESPEQSSETSAAAGTGTVGDISEGVEADPAVVALLPAATKEKGSITVAMDLKYPPTSFMNEDNEPAGYNVDIARLLAAKMGLELEIEDVSFSTIVPGLTGGRFDFTATNMSATPERLEQLDMINYWRDGSGLAVAAGNPKELDINTDSICGTQIAVMTGSTQEQTYLPMLSDKCTADGKDAVETVTLPDLNTALTQLSSGRIEGIFADLPQLAWAVAQQSSQFGLAEGLFEKPADLGTDLVAIGLAKGSPLTPAMQAAMQSIIDSPLYQEALDNWGLSDGAIETADIAG